MQRHGWVVPLPGGVKARCGGPALCAQCRREKKAVLDSWCPPANDLQAAAPPIDTSSLPDFSPSAPADPSPPDSGGYDGGGGSFDGGGSSGDW